MFITAQLRDTNKKVKIQGINTYAQFIAKIKATFKLQDEEFTFYYYEDNQRIDVDNDDSFECYRQEVKKPKIIIKLPDEDFLNQSFFQKSSKSNNDSAILAKLSQESPIKPQMNGQASFKKENKNEVKQEEMKASPQNVKKEYKVNQTVLIVHKNIKCHHCNLQVVGIRWKCLDEFDLDICNRCYQSKVHKQTHTLLRIETEDYLSKLNYRDSLYKLFNPKFEEGPSTLDQPIKPWIKEDDILQSNPEAVKQIWNASKELAEKVARDYDSWEKEWEAKSIKS